MKVAEHNRRAWNKQSAEGCRWCDPVDSRLIERARIGEWEICLTPSKAVPREWFGKVAGKKILCLASGGGQQAPILAAAGAIVTSFDNSDEQLRKDRLVAERDNVPLETIRGDMADLSALEDESFDMIFNPISNVFAENLMQVWSECYRVLKPEGDLLAAFMNPSFFLFDHDEAEINGEYRVTYSLPYSDLTSISEERRNGLIGTGRALEFGHSLDEQIGGQIRAGFTIRGFYEDWWDDKSTLFNKFSPTSIATLARK